MFRNSTSIFAISAALAMAPGVYAQDQDTEEEIDEIEEIIVTVERRSQSLQDYAGTAAAVSGDQIKALGLQNIKDLDGKVPGLSIANNQGNIEVYIRGVGSSNNTELGDPAVATHLNGVYVPRPSGYGVAFFDIQRVEVNVGPQGTLRGRNATGGSIDAIPWAPGIGVTDGSFGVGYGNFNEFTAEGHINLEVTENSAFRIAAIYREHDSRLENISPNGADLGLDIPVSEEDGVGVAEAAEDFGVRAAYKIELTERLTFTGTFDYISQAGTGFTGVNFAAPLGEGISADEIEDPRRVYGRGITPREDTDHWGAKAHVEYDGDGWNVEYIGSYRDLVYDYEFTTPAGPEFDGALDLFDQRTFDDFSRIRFVTDSESEVHELRFFSDDDQRLRWTAGAFYFQEDQRTFLGTTGDRNPFFQGIEFNQTTTTDSYSFYADATYDITDKFRVTGGVRYTEDEKERFGVNARYAFGIGGPDFGCCGTNAVGHGTEGFEFAALDRTIFNPDTSGDGLIDPQEFITFFFDGVAQFGDRDGFPAVFPNGQQVQDAQPDPTTRQQCASFNFAFVGSCGNFVPEFDGVLDFTLAPFLSNVALQNGALQNDFVDWRIRLEYDLTDDNLVYGLVSTGNKSGGFNDNIANTEGLSVNDILTSAPQEFDTDTLAPTYDPERLTLYELGSKNEFEIGDIGFTFNVSAFYYDYTDLQQTTLLSTAQILDFEGVDTGGLSEDDLDGLQGQIVGFTFNAANAEIYGMNIENKIELPDNWTINSNFLWLPEARIVDSQEIQDARFQADVDPDNAVNRDIEGNRLIRTPRIQWTGNVQKAWETDWGQVDVILAGTFRSSQHMTVFNGRTYGNPDQRERLDDRVGSFLTLDAGIGIELGTDEKPWRLEFYAQNLTNKDVVQGIIITQFDNTRFFNTPRLYGVRLNKRF